MVNVNITSKHLFSPKYGINRPAGDLGDNLYQTYFAEELASWSTKDLSQDFKACASVCKKYCGSLTLLLHHKEDVIDVLLSTLTKRGTLAVKSMLRCDLWVLY